MRSSQEAGRRSVEAHKSLARKDSAIPAVSPKSPRDSFVDISLPPPSAPCVASPRF